MYKESVEDRCLAAGGSLSFSILIEYSKGTTRVGQRWTICDADGRLVTKGGSDMTPVELLDGLQEASIEACLAWDRAHTAWGRPHLFTRL